MADEVDEANNLYEKELTYLISSCRSKSLPELGEGTCTECGDDANNLRNNICTDCRSILEKTRAQFR